MHHYWIIIYILGGFNLYTHVEVPIQEDVSGGDLGAGAHHAVLPPHVLHVSI